MRVPSVNLCALLLSSPQSLPAWALPSVRGSYGSAAPSTGKLSCLSRPAAAMRTDSPAQFKHGSEIAFQISDSLFGINF